MIMRKCYLLRRLLQKSYGYPVGATKLIPGYCPETPRRTRRQPLRQSRVPRGGIGPCVTSARGCQFHRARSWSGRLVSPDIPAQGRRCDMHGSCI